MACQHAPEGDLTTKKHLSASGLITLILGFVTFLWLLFHLYEIRTDLGGVLRFDLSDCSDILIGAGYLVMLAFHVAAFIFIFKLFKDSRFTNQFGGRQVPALMLGIFSLSAMAMEKVMYDGSNPLWLEAYGAYGASSDADFTTTRLTLLNRGFVYAIAHVRGGGDLGESWHDQGRVFTKRNTFSDFIHCAEYLIRERYTQAERLVARGGSAGGMLMGVAANWRPDLFRVIVADVPAMDELHHMLDPALPGVVSHYAEWGDPRDPEQFKYFRSWDAYTNIKAHDYPDMLLTAGLNDPRVPYWEPAKYVAKLRATKTDSNVLLLKTKISGHSRAPGLYDFLRELAFKYAFVLERMGLEGSDSGENARIRTPAKKGTKE